MAHATIPSQHVWLQLDELSLQQRKDSAETAALSAGAAVLSTVQAGHAISRLADESAAERVAEEAMREYGHAATRHLYFQRAQGQLLLRQLRFCSSELQGEPPPPRLHARCRSHPVHECIHACLPRQPPSARHVKGA